MQWLFEQQNRPIPKLSEAAVDCIQCQVRPPHKRVNQYPKQYKCCQFSPFLSSFAVGALMAQGMDMARFYEKAEGELVATRMGLVHSHEHRHNKGSLCHFFNKDSRECGIWQHRPGICFSFFCVSENSQIWDDLEMELLEGEAALLKEWHFQEGGTEEDWNSWGLVMEPFPVLEIPKSLLFQYWTEAGENYEKSWKWLLQKRSDHSLNKKTVLGP